MTEWDAGEKLTSFRKGGQYFAGVHLLSSLRSDCWADICSCSLLMRTSPQRARMPVRAQLALRSPVSRYCLTSLTRIPSLSPALPHYEPSPDRPTPISRDSPYLNDSGAQYLCVRVTCPLISQWLTLA